MTMRPLLAEPVQHEAESVDEVTELRDEIKELRGMIEQAVKNHERDRQKVGALLHGLRNLFSGNLEAVPSATASATLPPSRDAWEAWKRSLPDGCGKIIDALLVQPLKATQMISLCKMAYPTVTQNLRILERNGLIERDGRLIRLKRL